MTCSAQLASCMTRRGSDLYGAVISSYMQALPAAQIPLRIFEARYRVLFSTLLSGAEG